MADKEIPYHQLCQMVGDLYIQFQSEKSELYYKIEGYISELSSLRSENLTLKNEPGLSEEPSVENRELPGLPPGAFDEMLKNEQV